MYKAIDYTSKAMGGSFWTGFKATLVIMALEILFLFSFINYYTVITKTTNLDMDIDKPIVYVPILVLGIFNFLMFDITDKWKDYNKEFDQWPKRKNRIGTWIVLGIILFIVANVIFSFYLMSRIDWQSIRAQKTKENFRYFRV